MTDTTGVKLVRGWVGYDGACPLCRRMVRRLRSALARRGLVPVPLQDPSMRGRLGVSRDAPFSEMKLVLAGGRVLGGAAAATWIARDIWWLAPLGWMLWLPGIRRVTTAGYRWIARHRHCAGGVCAIRRTRRHRTIPFFELP